MRSIAALSLAFVAFTAALAIPPQASREFATVGSLEATDADFVFDLPSSTFTAKVNGVGQAQHFGHYALSMHVTVDMTSDTSEGTFSIEVANGDRLVGTMAGLGAGPTDVEDVVWLIEELTIESGTGRFKDATGSIMISRFANVKTFRSSGTIEGTVALPPNRG
jgi:hypothetical protein